LPPSQGSAKLIPTLSCNFYTNRLTAQGSTRMNSESFISPYYVKNPDTISVNAPISESSFFLNQKEPVGIHSRRQALYRIFYPDQFRVILLDQAFLPTAFRSSKDLFSRARKESSPPLSHFLGS